ncbi:5-oxoprolinase subunit PxpA [Sporolactobacillus sp. THM7-4]|nr:5-oxoprolinase subunit PxpA [Sporolactobacillus sp. THM7-4]
MAINIDICSDLGEGFGRYKLANDDKMLDIVTSANLACGFHAGDPCTMKKMVELTFEKGIGVGAHPGFPDRVGFGRRNMDLSYEEIYTDVLYQIGALSGFLQAKGANLQHVIPHGQLGNMAQKNETYAEAIINAIYDFDPSLIVFVQPVTPCYLKTFAEKKEMKTATVIFADRAYNDDYSLVSRKIEGSVITDENVVVNRSLRMITKNKVTTITGKELTIKGDTLLLHGDTNGSMLLAKKIKETLIANGVNVAPLGKWL